MFPYRSRAVALVLLLLLCGFGSTAAEAARWVRQNPVGPLSVRGVWGSSGSDGFAVGQDGTILHYGNEPLASGGLTVEDPAAGASRLMEP